MVETSNRGRSHPQYTTSVDEFDPLRAEGLGYARKLLAADDATYHGGDTETLAFVPDAYRATIRDIHGFAASF